MLNLLLIIFQALLMVLSAPLFVGVIKKCKCWSQNRSAPSVLLPYRNLKKLWNKQVLCAENSSYIFTLTPYLLFSIALALTFFLPWLITVNTNSVGVSGIVTSSLVPLLFRDVLVVIGLLALSRFFLALAALDVGTAFGGMGASREMLFAVLVEPAQMTALFTLAIIAASTDLNQIMHYVSVHQFWLKPSLLLTGIGFVLIIAAETGRIPFDNPATHLELTMIHEAMILEYSGRHLALIEWAAQIKLLFYFILFANLFLPSLPMAVLDFNNSGGQFLFLLGNFLTSGAVLVLQLMLLVAVLVVAEINLAKLRLFKAPLLLSVAFTLCLLGLMNHIILEVN